jgi:hypothetical protein
MSETATIDYPVQEQLSPRPTLFRACCHSSAARLEDHTPSDEIVFIDAVDRDDAARRLTPLLGSLWHVPVESIGFYNLMAEYEFYADSANIRGGDLRLLEVGYCGARGPLYPSPNTMPYMLVRPETIKRLKQAWATIPADAWRGGL